MGTALMVFKNDSGKVKAGFGILVICGMQNESDGTNKMETVRRVKMLSLWLIHKVIRKRSRVEISYETTN